MRAGKENGASPQRSPVLLPGGNQHREASQHPAEKAFHLVCVLLRSGGDKALPFP